MDVQEQQDWARVRKARISALLFSISVLVFSNIPIVSGEFSLIGRYTVDQESFAQLLRFASFAFLMNFVAKENQARVNYELKPKLAFLTEAEKRGETFWKFSQIWLHVRIMVGMSWSSLPVFIFGIATIVEPKFPTYLAAYLF
ncbi:MULTISPECIES: hypothetical protein [Falsihalocynthiibacter]|uniref:hypothetical protein n=1 Tax=Falsihalocynthiibacter TaxID=2854182 RepID=UPI0030024063